jgi:hypothetical protein
VLTGVIAALCGQGLPALDARRAGVHLHGWPPTRPPPPSAPGTSSPAIFPRPSPASSSPARRRRRGRRPAGSPDSGPARRCRCGPQRRPPGSATHSHCRATGPRGLPAARRPRPAPRACRAAWALARWPGAGWCGPARGRRGTGSRRRPGPRPRRRAPRRPRARSAERRAQPGAARAVAPAPGRAGPRRAAAPSKAPARRELAVARGGRGQRVGGALGGGGICLQRRDSGAPPRRAGVAGAAAASRG